MKQVPFKKLAKELGAIVSYLSQVTTLSALHHKGLKTISTIKVFKQSVKKNFTQYARILSQSISGGVPELADGHDLGLCVARRGGSSPPFPTTNHSQGITNEFWIRRAKYKWRS